MRKRPVPKILDDNVQNLRDELTTAMATAERRIQHQRTAFSTERRHENGQLTSAIQIEPDRINESGCISLF